MTVRVGDGKSSASFETLLAISDAEDERTSDIFLPHCAPIYPIKCNKSPNGVDAALCEYRLFIIRYCKMVSKPFSEIFKSDGIFFLLKNSIENLGQSMVHRESSRERFSLIVRNLNSNAA